MNTTKAEPIARMSVTTNGSTKVTVTVHRLTPDRRLFFSTYSNLTDATKARIVKLIGNPDYPLSYPSLDTLTISRK